MTYQTNISHKCHNAILSIKNEQTFLTESRKQTLIIAGKVAIVFLSAAAFLAGAYFILGAAFVGAGTTRLFYNLGVGMGISGLNALCLGLNPRMVKQTSHPKKDILNYLFWLTIQSTFFIGTCSFLTLLSKEVGRWFVGPMVIIMVGNLDYHECEARWKY